LLFDLPSVLCEYLVKEFPESRTHVAVLCPPWCPLSRVLRVFGKRVPQISRSRCPCYCAWSCVWFGVHRSASRSVFFSSFHFLLSWLLLLSHVRSWISTTCVLVLSLGSNVAFIASRFLLRVSRYFLAFSARVLWWCVALFWRFSFA